MHDAQPRVVLAVLRYHRLVQLLSIAGFPVIVVVDASDVLHQGVIRYLAVYYLRLLSLEVASHAEVLVDLLPDAFVLQHIRLLLHGLVNDLSFVKRYSVTNFDFLLLNCIHQGFFIVVIFS